MKILTEKTELVPQFPVERLAQVSEILFFDIETTGLRKETTQVYLIGCAFFSETENSWMIRQYFAESALDEREIMESFCDFAKDFRVLIHFNGDGFDIPYLSYKASFYDLDLDFSSFLSFDIYKMAKPLKKVLGLENMKQKSIERFLGIERDDRFGGGALIPVFYEYERTGDPEAEHLLLLHNFDDVKGMFQILKILYYTEIPDGGFSFQRMEIVQGMAILEYELNDPLPSNFEKQSADGNIVVAADGTLLQISITIFEGQALLPLEDVENYFYLPEEDRVIHKDVAQFVDKAHRRKATKKNCFLKKEGSFLPQKHPLFSPAFQVSGVKKLTFFELNDSVTDDHNLLTEYALDIMNY